MDPIPKNSVAHRFWVVFFIFLRLGLTSFGGPIAHLGYFRDEFVSRRKWLSERSYVDLVALCQFLPGPASSQVGIGLGFLRSGYSGAVAAWLGFTLPSALAMMLLALGISNSDGLIPTGMLQGLKVAAVAIVAQAVWGMARSLCPDTPRITIMAIATCCVLMVPTAWGQMAVIVLAALVGLWLLKPAQVAAHEPLPIHIRRRTGVLWLALFFVLLLGVPILATAFPSPTLSMLSAFYRAGALVFGGGHVVLPLLQTEVVAAGWIGNDAFLAGYGATQAMPGPLFSFAAFLGSSMQQSPTGWLGGWLCLLAIFAPSFLLVFGALPFWEALRHSTRTQAALLGVNAAVVGLLLAALYHPVWTNAITAPQDFGLALLALVALIFWRQPVWLVVVCCGVMGSFFSLLA